MDNDDDEYRSRTMFLTTEGYSNYVRKRVKKGMRIRCCESVENIDVFEGQTGIVVAITREKEFKIKVIFNIFSVTYKIPNSQC